MFEFLQAVLAVFAMVGIIASVYFFLLKLLSIRRARKYVVLLLPPSMDHSDAECMIRGAHLRAQLIGTELLAVDCGLSGDARSSAELVCAELERVCYCPADQIAEYLKEKVKGSES